MSPPEPPVSAAHVQYAPANELSESDRRRAMWAMALSIAAAVLCVLLAAASFVVTPYMYRLFSDFKLKLPALTMLFFQLGLLVPIATLILGAAAVGKEFVIPSLRMRLLLTVAALVLTVIASVGYAVSMILPYAELVGALAG